MIQRLLLIGVVGLFLLTEKGWGKWTEFLVFRGVARAIYPHHAWLEQDATGQEKFSLARLRTPKRSKSSVVLEFNDDPDRYFSNAPPAAIDYAVVLENLRRSNPHAVLISSNLAWDDADEYAIAALTKTASQFPRLIFSAGLTRAPQSAEMPEAMKRASLPIAAVRGEVAALPLVNRFAVVSTVMDGGASWGGFSFLEGIKPSSGIMPLLARWGDRVVFSSVLLFELAERGFAVDGLEIVMGKYIRMAADGPIVAIDEFGQMRLTDEPNVAAPHGSIMAHELLDEGYAFPYAADGSKSVMLMDFSQKQGGEFQLVQTSMYAAMREIKRVPILANRIAFRACPLWLAWSAYALLISVLVSCPKPSQRLIACLLWLGIWTFVVVAFQLWCPLTPLVAVVVTMEIFGGFFTNGLKGRLSLVKN